MGKISLLLLLKSMAKMAKFFAKSAMIKADRTFIGDVRLAWACGIGVVEIRDPAGERHLSIQRCHYDELFARVDSMQEEIWKVWAAKADYEDLVLNARIVGKLRLEFAQNKAIQRSLDTFMGVILDEQRNRRSAEEAAVILNGVARAVI